VNIMQFLEDMIPSINAEDPRFRGNSGLMEVLSQMEIAIREGIAQELEDLVGNQKPVKNWGVPNSAAVFAQTTAITPTNPAIQQEYFRAAANVVRGKHLATEDDWHEQAEAMKHRWIDNFAAEYGKLPEYSTTGMDRLDIANIVNAHENALALEAEKAEERRREWNS